MLGHRVVPVRSPWASRLTALVALLSAASCTTSVAPWQGKDLRPDPEERRLWSFAEETEQTLERRGRLYDDEPELLAYLNEVKDHVVRPFALDPQTVRVRVLRDPFLNAAAFPNGSVYVHMGTLSRLENEAQLALVLAHEVTHFAHRHAVLEMRNRDRTTAVAVAATALTGLPLLIEMTLDMVGHSLYLAQLQGYSRQLEREADQWALRSILAAGYEPRTALHVFRHFLEEERELGGEAGIRQPYWYASHPALEERIRNGEEFLASESIPATAVRVERERYMRATARVRLEAAKMDLALKRYQNARRAIDRQLAASPAEARGYVALGDWYRIARPGEGWAEDAKQAYRQALERDPSSAEAHRELGLLCRELADHACARSHLQRYLELAGGAKDRAIIEGFLGEMKGKSGS